MTPKEYLKQIETLDIMAKNKRAELAELHADVADLQSALAGGERVQTSPKANPSYVAALERIEKLEREITQSIEQLTAKRDFIINQINALGSKEYIQILYKRYVEYKKLEQIAVEMCYTYQHIRRMHGYALTEFKRCYTMLHHSMLK